MPGFFVSNTNVSTEMKNMYPGSCVRDQLPNAGATIRRHTLNRFLSDKAFSVSDRGAVVSEGVLLNKKELFNEYEVQTVDELLWDMYLRYGEVFARDLRGPFSCVLYEADADKWLIYTNHIGENPVFYLVDEGRFYAGSQVNYILEAAEAMRINLSLDERAAYEMLTFGYMESNRTFALEIKRLRGGQYLRVEGGKASVCEYHAFHKHTERTDGKSSNELIEMVDAAFCRAVKMEYDKDIEYGYKHLADISGGLDSRMGAWIAHEQGEKHIQMITYGKANYLDEIIAKQVSEYWGDELLCKPLDDLSFLRDINENTFMLGGTSDYARLTGGKRLLESLNMSTYGLEHTGQIGDAILGSFYRHPDDGDKNLPDKRFSNRLLHRLRPEENEYHTLFDDHELYLIYTRLFQSAANSHLIRKNYTEVVSPFLDVDFIQLCLDIPVEKRIGHELYKQWILRKHLEAARFKWEAMGAYLTDPKPVFNLRRIAAKGPDKLRRIMHQEKRVKNDMNPLDHFLKRHPEISSFLSEYEERGYQFLPSDTSEVLIQDMKSMFAEGEVFEKTMVLTVLSSARLFFSNQER